MNAEDCPKHRDLIDVPGEGGIYYPWVCECPYRHWCDNCEGIDPDSCLFNSTS